MAGSLPPSSFLLLRLFLFFSILFLYVPPPDDVVVQECNHFRLRPPVSIARPCQYRDHVREVVANKEKKEKHDTTTSSATTVVPKLSRNVNASYATTTAAAAVVQERKTEVKLPPTASANSSVDLKPTTRRTRPPPATKPRPKPPEPPAAVNNDSNVVVVPKVAAIRGPNGTVLTQDHWEQIYTAAEMATRARQLPEDCATHAGRMGHAQKLSGSSKPSPNVDSFSPRVKTIIADVAEKNRIAGVTSPPYAVLMTGQIRGGYRGAASDSIRRMLQASLPKQPVDQPQHHLFAVLEPTMHGYDYRGPRGRGGKERRFKNSTIERIVGSYGFSTEKRTLFIAHPGYDDEFMYQYMTKVGCRRPSMGGHGLSLQYLKGFWAYNMMEEYEKKNRYMFGHVIRVRPDLYLNGAVSATLRGNMDGVLCRALGGGGGDSVVMTSRAGALVYRYIFMTIKNCPLDSGVEIDSCRTWEPFYEKCMGGSRSGAGQLQEYCSHALGPTAHRLGFRVTHCGVGGGYAAMGHWGEIKE